MTQMTDVTTDDVRCSDVQHHVHLKRLCATHLLRVSDCTRVFLSNKVTNHQYEYHCFASVLINGRVQCLLSVSSPVSRGYCQSRAAADDLHMLG